MDKIIEWFIIYKYSIIIIDDINYKSTIGNNNSIDLNIISIISENLWLKQFYINIEYKIYSSIN